MRTRPYTERGIRRVPCVKCGAPSSTQWQICADGNTFRGLCVAHDIELNTIVLRWAVGEGSAAEPLKRYIAERAG